MGRVQFCPPVCRYRWSVASAWPFPGRQVPLVRCRYRPRQLRALCPVYPLSCWIVAPGSNWAPPACTVMLVVCDECPSVVPCPKLPPALPDMIIMDVGVTVAVGAVVTLATTTGVVTFVVRTAPAPMALASSSPFGIVNILATFGFTCIHVRCRLLGRSDGCYTRCSVDFVMI